MHRLIPAVVAFTLLVTACGGSSADDESQGTAGSTRPEATADEAPASAGTTGPPSTRRPAPTIPRPGPTASSGGSSEGDETACNPLALAEALGVDEASVDGYECEDALAFARIGGSTAIVSTYLLQTSGSGWVVVAQLELQPEACAANGAPSNWCAGFGTSGDNGDDTGGDDAGGEPGNV